MNRYRTFSEHERTDGVITGFSRLRQGRVLTSPHRASKAERSNRRARCFCSFASGKTGPTGRFAKRSARHRAALRRRNGQDRSLQSRRGGLLRFAPSGQTVASRHFRSAKALGVAAHATVGRDAHIAPRREGVTVKTVPNTRG